MGLLARIQHWYRALPDKKRYLEFFAALLTVPVLFTVLISNVSNLQNQKKTNVSPTPIITTIIQTATPAPTATPNPECVKQVGPIDLVYPEDGDTVSGDPVCLDVVRQSTNYCSVVWSYRINGGAWSEYTDKSICMYGLPPGTKNLELRVKSIVSPDTVVINRKFTVEQSATPVPASPSATPEN